MNELTKYNRLTKRTCFDEIIIKKGIFLLPNTFLVLHDDTKIIFRNTISNEDEDLDSRFLTQSGRIASLEQKISELEDTINLFSQNITSEIKKAGFISVCEAEGLLQENSFPFSYGMGTQSNPEYGLPISYSFTIRSISYSSISSDSSITITCKILFYPFSESTPTTLYEELIFKDKNISLFPGPVSTSVPGNIVIQVISVSGLTDETSKFRLSFIFTSDDIINTD